jgi:hypothetical protein
VAPHRQPLVRACVAHRAPVVYDVNLTVTRP